MIYPQCNACVSDPSSLQPNTVILVCFRRKVEERSLLIMEAILEQLGLGTLLEKFSDEKVDPHLILAMLESALIRLGVATMGVGIRMKELCREAVDCSGDSNGADAVNCDSSGWSTSAAEQVREERRLFFCPYNQSGSNRGRSASAGQAGQKKERSQTNMDGTVCLFGGSACMQGTFFS